MSELLITIGLPVRNASATLPAAITSILGQTYPNWELIVVDDGSTDGTRRIADEASRQDDRIRVICDGRSLGLAWRLNETIALAQGELFARMDGDDIAYPGRLERQAAYLREHEAVDLLGSAMLIFRGDGSVTGVRRGPTAHADICERPEWGFRMFHPTWAGRTQWFRDHKYRVAGGEDQELLLRTHTDSRFANLPDVLLGYRQERVPLRRTLRNRRRFARRMTRVMLDRGQPHLAISGAVKQLALGATDVAAVGLKMEDHVLRQRAKPASDAELAEWEAVWRTLGAPG